MRKILIVAGTRPEAIKMAPVLFALRSSAHLHPVVCSTGQHREMLQQAWDDFGIQPDVELDLMAQEQSLAGLSSRLFSAVDTVLEVHKPDMLLVQGDTTTVMVAALCAFYRNIPVGHVEAGLRSHDFTSPFPEELNRRVVSLATALHFAPTVRAANNLRAEGIPAERIIVTGNTVVDALHFMRSRMRQKPPTVPEALAATIREKRPLVLITVHRRELSAEGLNNICASIQTLAREFSHVTFVWPVHLNPRIRDTVVARLGAESNILLTAPLSYPVFVVLLDCCRIVISDSGGIQEEAPSFGKRVLVLREVTERPEGVETKFCTLVGSDPEAICAAARPLLETEPAAPAATNPFGDGQAAGRVRKAIETFFSD